MRCARSLRRAAPNRFPVPSPAENDDPRLQRSPSGRRRPLRRGDRGAGRRVRLEHVLSAALLRHVVHVDLPVRDAARESLDGVVPNLEVLIVRRLGPVLRPLETGPNLRCVRGVSPSTLQFELGLLALDSRLAGRFARILCAAQGPAPRVRWRTQEHEHHAAIGQAASHFGIMSQVRVGERDPALELLAIRAVVRAGKRRARGPEALDECTRALGSDRRDHAAFSSSVRIHFTGPSAQSLSAESLPLRSGGGWNSR